jgi:hypothetical protein
VTRPPSRRSRWPARRRPPGPVEPPAWFRCFVFEDWTEPGDEDVRFPAGALMGAEEVARRRWIDACRRWAKENGFDVASWLYERRRARLATLLGEDDDS